MKCEVKLEERNCKRCGFRTDNPLIMACPRCMGPIPGPTSCSGGCGSCKKTHAV